jgi:hypothetical protein
MDKLDPNYEDPSRREKYRHDLENRYQREHSFNFQTVLLKTNFISLQHLIVIHVMTEKKIQTWMVLSRQHLVSFGRCWILVENIFKLEKFLQQCQCSQQQ